MRYTGAIHREPPIGTPRLADHINFGAMAPAGGTDWQSKVTLGDPISNDTKGTCVSCAKLRDIQFKIFNAIGSDWTPTADDALALQTADTGGVFNPNDPATDIGLDPNVSMGRWCSVGYQVNPQLLDVPVRAIIDPTNFDHLRMAIDTLCALQLTLALPKAAAEASEFTCVPVASDPATAPYSEGGHQVCSARHGDGGLYVVSWGQQFFTSVPFLKAYCVGASALVSRRWLAATGLSPSGLNLDALAAEAATLRV
jgi:hypothetical protein